ncbi:MAG: radical SAM protein, partial [Clostridia bacterium]|nr:radical SAM protein [Clostridia bacterium]
TRYGEDQGQNNFVNLIKKISKLDNICHIRLLYCYPEKIDGTLIAEIRDNPKILKYLDIPLQHSENRILKLMGRRGTREEYGELFETLRKEIPEIALRTTFITGFPSETEEEHKALIEFIKEQKFENAGIFAYSREPETPAYKMKGQIPASVKKRRQRELYEAQREVSQNFLKSFLDKTIPVVCDGVNDEGTGFVGRAYFQAPEIDGNVFFTSPRAKEGEIYHIRINGSSEYDLFGVAVTE